MCRIGWLNSDEKLLKQTVDVQSRVLGPMHPDTLTTAGHLSMIYLRLGKYAQAKALASFCRETLFFSEPTAPCRLGSGISPVESARRD